MREAAPLDHGTERCKLTRIHKHPLCMTASPWTSWSSIRRVPETTPRLEDTFIRSYRQLAQDSPLRSRDAILRALDVLFAAVFLLISLPLVLVLAVVLLLTSGRPIFYGGDRVGRGGRIFRMYKFRTLKADAESRLGPYLGEELVERTESEYTPGGRWLKASQLDEIPQFWNVLRAT